MTRPNGLFVWPEGCIQQIGGAEGDIEQRPFAGRLVMSDCSLVQMPQVIQLMTVHTFENPALGTRPRMGMRRIDRARGVSEMANLCFINSPWILGAPSIGIPRDRAADRLSPTINSVQPGQKPRSVVQTGRLPSRIQ